MRVRRLLSTVCPLLLSQARGLPVPPHALLCHAHARRDRQAAASAEPGLLSSLADDDGGAAASSAKVRTLELEPPSFRIGPAGVVPKAIMPGPDDGAFLVDTRSPEELLKGMVVRVSSAITATHNSPPSLEVGPAPLWYHALALPYVPLLTDDGTPALPPGLRFSVLLDGRTIGQTDDGALALSATPRWVPLSATDDSAVDAGSLLVWCTEDPAVLKQVRKGGLGTSELSRRRTPCAPRSGALLSGSTWTRRYCRRRSPSRARRQQRRQPSRTKS